MKSRLISHRTVAIWLLAGLRIMGLPSRAFGGLLFVQAQFDGVGGVHGIQNPGSLVVSPDGQHVYVGGNDGVDDTGQIAVFGRNATTGELTFIDAESDGSLPYPFSIHR